MEYKHAHFETLCNADFIRGHNVSDVDVRPLLGSEVSEETVSEEAVEVEVSGDYEKLELNGRPGKDTPPYSEDCNVRNSSLWPEDTVVRKQFYHMGNNLNEYPDRQDDVYNSFLESLCEEATGTDTSCSSMQSTLELIGKVQQNPSQSAYAEWTHNTLVSASYHVAPDSTSHLNTADPLSELSIYQGSTATEADQGIQTRNERDSLCDVANNILLSISTNKDNTNKAYQSLITPESSTSILRIPEGETSDLRTPEDEINVRRTSEGATSVLRTPEGAAIVQTTLVPANSFLGTPEGAASILRSPSITISRLRTPEGTTSGLRTPEGTTGGLRTPEGTSSGLRTPEGTSSGLRTPEGATSGLRNLAGTNSGLRNLAGTSSGLRTPEGATSGLRNLAGTNSGLRTPEGVTSGLRNLAETNSGLRTPEGATGGLRTPVGTTSGLRTPEEITSSLRVPEYMSSSCKIPENMMHRDSSLLSQKYLGDLTSVDSDDCVNASNETAVNLTGTSHFIRDHTETSAPDLDVDLMFSSSNDEYGRDARSDSGIQNPSWQLSSFEFLDLLEFPATTDQAENGATNSDENFNKTNSRTIDAGDIFRYSSEEIRLFNEIMNDDIDEPCSDVTHTVNNLSGLASAQTCVSGPREDPVVTSKKKLNRKFIVPPKSQTKQPLLSMKRVQYNWPHNIVDNCQSYRTETIHFATYPAVKKKDKKKLPNNFCRGRPRCVRVLTTTSSCSRLMKRYFSERNLEYSRSSLSEKTPVTHDTPEERVIEIISQSGESGNNTNMAASPVTVLSSSLSPDLNLCQSVEHSWIPSANNNISTESILNNSVTGSGGHRHFVMDEDHESGAFMNKPDDDEDTVLTTVQKSENYASLTGRKGENILKICNNTETKESPIRKPSFSTKNVIKIQVYTKSPRRMIVTRVKHPSYNDSLAVQRSKILGNANWNPLIKSILGQLQFLSPDLVKQISLPVKVLQRGYLTLKERNCIETQAKLLQTLRDLTNEHRVCSISHNCEKCSVILEKRRTLTELQKWKPESDAKLKKAGRSEVEKNSVLGNIKQRPYVHQSLCTPDVVDNTCTVSLEIKPVNKASPEQRMESTVRARILPWFDSQKKRGKYIESLLQQVDIILRKQGKNDQRCECSDGCRSVWSCWCCQIGNWCRQASCTCVSCLNPLSELRASFVNVEAAKLDPCLMQKIYDIKDLYQVLREEHQVPCCGTLLKTYQLIPNVVECYKCKSLLSYSWCHRKIFVEKVRQRNHCILCSRCQPFMYLHCCRCSSCTLFSSSGKCLRCS